VGGEDSGSARASEDAEIGLNSSAQRDDMLRLKIF
jgi:hypothetical protein